MPAKLIPLIALASLIFDKVPSMQIRRVGDGHDQRLSGCSRG